MTNSYDVDHGLSQCPPGPLEPVEVAQQDDTLARTGNTARDQEMYVAGIRTGEENAKHNAAIRAGAPGVSTVEDKPAAYLTLDEEGSPCMLFFDVAEARGYCALGEEPEALYRRPAPAAGDALDAARFRFLRDKSTVSMGSASFGPFSAHKRDTDFFSREEGLQALDAAIDAAIAAQRKGDA